MFSTAHNSALTANNTGITAQVYASAGNRPYADLSDEDFSAKAAEAQEHLLGLTMMDMGWSGADRLLAHNIGMEEMARAGRVFDIAGPAFA